MTKDPDFSERYNRQLILRGFGIAAQEKLAKAGVLVIGAGGLGCPALQYLAAAGIGRIGIVDDDEVSISNLHRQILYTSDDIGRPKAHIAAARLSRMNPGISIFPYSVRLDNNNALQLIRQYDYVLDGSDNFATRYLVNDACMLLNKPLVFGAVSEFSGQVAVFNSVNEPGPHMKLNYRDLFPVAPADGEVLNCAEAGVLGVLPGIIGTMQAAELIKLITGIGTTLTGRLRNIDLLSGETYEIELTHNDAYQLPEDEEAFRATEYGFWCSGAGAHNKTGKDDAFNGTVASSMIREIDADQFESLLKDDSIIAIDVREAGEEPTLIGYTYLRLPISSFAESADHLKGERFLLFCQSGKRSLQVARMLQASLGSEAEIYSLKGGLGQFSEQTFLTFAHE